MGRRNFEHVGHWKRDQQVKSRLFCQLQEECRACMLPSSSHPQTAWPARLHALYRPCFVPSLNSDYGWLVDDGISLVGLSYTATNSRGRGTILPYLCPIF